MAMVSLHWVEVNSTVDSNLSSVLSDEEHSAAERLRRPEDRAAYRTAHGLARLSLGQILGRAPSSITFQREQGRKPQVDASTASVPDFSISHSRGHVACAVGVGTVVGVDIESVGGGVVVPESVLQYALTESEHRWCETAESAAQKQSLVLQLWTMKEALLKASGHGLSVQPLTIGVDVPLVPHGYARLNSLPDELATSDWQLIGLDAGPVAVAAVAMDRPATLSVNTSLPLLASGQAP